MYLNRNLQTAKVEQSFPTNDQNPKQVLNPTVEKLGFLRSQSQTKMDYDWKVLPAADEVTKLKYFIVELS